MKQFTVHSGNEILKIHADDLSIEDGVLKFYRGREVIASFTTWQYWIFEGNKVNKAETKKLPVDLREKI